MLIRVDRGRPHNANFSVEQVMGYYNIEHISRSKVINLLAEWDKCKALPIPVEIKELALSLGIFASQHNPSK